MNDELDRILLLGKTGLIGQEFLRIFEDQDIDFIAPSSQELDVLDFEKLANFIHENNFSKIIYCVAFTDVDGAEVQKEACRALNTELIRVLTTLNVSLIHFSTDYVFDAPKNFEISENYPRKALSVYAQSKLDAETILENSDVDFWNIRTSWVFGNNKNNFISKIIELSKNKTELKVINDQIGRPTYSRDLAEFVVEHFIQNKLPTGHYHLQNTGIPTSWFDLAQYVLDLRGWKGNLIPVSTEEFGARAKRPKNSVLKNTKISGDLNDWKAGVQSFFLDQQP